MSWKSTIVDDTDDPEVSTTTAIWTDPNPALGQFTYNRRVNRRGADEDLFVTEANSEKDAWAIEQARLIADQDALDVKLNA